MNYHLLPEHEYEFEFTFYHSDEPLYILHDQNHFDPTMLHMLVEFEVDLADIKQWTVTKQDNKGVRKISTIS